MPQNTLPPGEVKWRAQRDAIMDARLQDIHRDYGTLGAFMKALFTVPQTQVEKGNGQRHAQMVSAFLSGRTTVTVVEIVELMYTSRYSAPISVRSTPGRPASDVSRRNEKMMAQWLLLDWAITKVEGVIDREAAEVASKDGGFHMRDKEASWDFVHEFSMQRVLSLFATKGPTILRLVVAAAVPVKERLILQTQTYETYFSKPPPSGIGQNRRDPLLIALVACLMLMSARNLHFTMFQKIVGLWLFAHTASYGIYAVLSRIGLSVSYTTVSSLLCSLSESAKKTVQQKAKMRAFQVIYDNINRRMQAWDPDLGERDRMHNGTAATYVELEDCDVEKAFEISILREAQEQQRRKALSLDVLYNRVDWAKLNAVMAHHALNMLAEAVPSLQGHRDLIKLRFETSLAMHRMRAGRKTTLHPLATSDFNEGVTAENAKVLDDLLIRQLGLSKEEVARLLVIVGGDQSTVEKLRTLKKFMATCPHGYSQYGWVLPLIQLWHMGWADLERVLNTHWGKSEADDLSSFRAANVLLGRKVKDQKRPDYYPAQHLVFDTLKAEVLDCWRVHLNVSDLDEYFTEHQIAFEDLLKLANEIRDHYLSTEAYERAVDSAADSVDGFFKTGSLWTSPTAEGSPAESQAMPVVSEVPQDVEPIKPFRGDQVLGNTILRMRDSVLHYEFQCAIAEGDIGRAMNVMAVWTFTFTGSGRSKYANELLEMACQFEYEYSDDLKKALLNNWLCNLSGIPGCWFPMDLLQEKNIKQLKKMSQKRDASFGGQFFKEIIALNIRAFLLATSSMKAAVRVGSTSGTHHRSVKNAAMKELARNFTEQELHKFQSGRTSTHVAKDDFTAGYARLADGKRINDFVARTLRDAGAIHEDDSLDDIDDNLLSQNSRPMPNVHVDGTLVVGADNSDMESEIDDADDSDDSEIMDE